MIELAKRITNRIKMEQSRKWTVRFGGRGSSKMIWLKSVSRYEFECMFPPLYRFGEMTTKGDEEVFRI